MDNFGSFGTLFVIVVTIMAFALFMLAMANFGAWMRAWTGGTRISYITLMVMRLRRLNTKEIVEAYSTAQKAGFDLDMKDIAAQAQAGGHPIAVVQAMVEAQQSGIELAWPDATALDLAGRDVVENVRDAAARGITRVPRVGEAQQ